MATRRPEINAASTALARARLPLAARARRWPGWLFGGDDPQHLLPRLGLLALLAALTAAGLSWIAIEWVYRGQMIRDAEAAAISVGQVMFANERAKLLVRDSSGNEALHVPADRVGDIDALAHRYLDPFSIRKIKIFSSDKRVVYSSDRGLIGRRDDTNRTLDRVLREGVVDSTAKQTNQFTELGGSVVENRQIVETYLPVISGERVLGAFEVYVDITRAAKATNRAVLATAALVGAIVALAMLALYLAMRRGAMPLQAAQRHLNESAASDPLGRVLDRDALVRHGQREVEKLQDATPRRIAGIGLVMLGIDHNARGADARGQAAADAISQAAARCLGAATRKRDLLGRYGEQEFLLVLPATTRTEASALAARLQTAVSATQVALPDGSRIGLGASFGVAQIDLSEKDFDSALRRADEALQWARQSRASRNGGVG
ncbi:MAG: diguanylate cyclase [Sterolibacteriaceae bacterium]|nr:diguanylate cyclase [Candidatus Methylophosphatis haderslevensis]